MPGPGDGATESLAGAVAGDHRAADRLLALVYDELRQLAAECLRDERRDHTLQPTALVHEAYLRLVRTDEVDWQGRAHFLAVAARTLRRVLIDHGRRRGAQKRGGAVDRLSIDALELEAECGTSMLELEEVLERLGRVSERQSRIVELRVFGGLTVDETAGLLELPREAVQSEWRFARAWLRRELERGEQPR